MTLRDCEQSVEFRLAEKMEPNMNRLLMPVLLGLSLTLPTCGKKEENVPPPTSSEGVQKKAAEATGAKKDQAQQARNEFVGKAQKEMDELNNKMAELKNKAQTLTGAAKDKLDQQIQSLERERKAAEQKLAELQSATGEKWNELKAGVSDAVEHLKQSIQKTKEGSF